MLSANRYALTRPWKDACPEPPMPPVCAKSLQSCPTLSSPMDCSPPGSSVMGFSRQDTEVGCHAFFQGIILTQGLNPSLLHLLHWQVGSLPLASTTWEAPTPPRNIKKHLTLKLCWLGTSLRPKAFHMCINMLNLCNDSMRQCLLSPLYRHREAK